MSETVNYKAATLSGSIFSGAGTGLAAPPSSAQSDVQTFRGPGTPVVTGGTFTWVKPPAGSMVLVECWGGGGCSQGAAGGGGAGYTSTILPFSAVSPTVSVVVADGGTTGNRIGRNSTFGPYGTSTVTAYGGNFGNLGPGGAGGGMAGVGGGTPTALPGAQGGGTGAPSPLINGIIYGGGGGGGTNFPGSFSSAGGSSVYGGGGGGTFPGSAGGISVYGGAGGPGAPGVSRNGLIPGGGGGGFGGEGASGQVRVTVF